MCALEEKASASTIDNRTEKGEKKMELRMVNCERDMQNAIFSAAYDAFLYNRKQIVHFLKTLRSCSVRCDKKLEANYRANIRQMIQDARKAQKVLKWCESSKHDMIVTK